MENRNINGKRPGAISPPQRESTKRQIQTHEAETLWSALSITVHKPEFIGSDLPMNEAIDESTYASQRADDYNDEMELDPIPNTAKLPFEAQPRVHSSENNVAEQSVLEELLAIIAPSYSRHTGEDFVQDIYACEEIYNNITDPVQSMNIVNLQQSLRKCPGLLEALLAGLITPDSKSRSDPLPQPPGLCSQVSGRDDQTFSELSGASWGQKILQTVTQLRDDLREFESEVDTLLDSNSSIQSEKGRVPDEYYTENYTSIILFAPTGTGKTQRIHNLLSSQFGFYLHACGLPNTLDRPQVDDPKRLGGSQDTQTLMELIRRAERLPEPFRESRYSSPATLAVHWLGLLLTLRCSLLAMFIGVAARKNISIPGNLPQIWLHLQTKSGKDYFDKVFRHFLRLPQPFENVLLDEIYPKELDQVILKSGMANIQLYYCLDEAQADSMQFVHRHDGQELPLLQLWAQAFANSRRRVCRSAGNVGSRLGQPLPKPLIYAGTSLEIKRVVDAVLSFGRPRCNQAEKLALMHQDFEFELIKDQQDFMSMMARHRTSILLDENCSEMRDELQNHIISQAKPLFGRPGWSVLFLEEVNKVLRGGPRGDISGRIMEIKAYIEKSAKAVHSRIKSSLLARLRHLADTQKHDNLIRELLNNVIHSILEDRASASMSDDGHILITHGFAFMERDSNDRNRQVLKESLAIESANEFFFDERPEMVESKLKDILEAIQSHNGATGTYAESFLAYNLHRLFTVNASPGPLIGSTEPQRLKALIRRLSSATALSNDPATGALNLAGYTLVLGNKVGHLFDSERPYELYEWMNEVRSQKTPKCTFYFPQNETGPDIVFALSPPDTDRDKVMLCLLQLKCGSPGALEEAHETTDLRKAFSKRKKSDKVNDKEHDNDLISGAKWKTRREKLDKEVDEWEKGNFPILRVLFTALTGQNNKGAKAVQGTRCKEYYIRLDKNDTGNAFGEDFARLLGIYKNESPSETALAMYQREFVRKEQQYFCYK